MESFFKIKNKIEIYTYEDSIKIGDSVIRNIAGEHIYLRGFEHETDFDLTAGDQINALYYSENGKVYGFSSEIVETSYQKNDNIVIRMPKSYVSVQRRSAVRIPLIMDILYFNMGEQIAEDPEKASFAEIKSEYKDKLTKTYSLNLSATGMGVHIPEFVRENDRLLILLENEDIEIAIVGEIVRAVVLDKGEGRFRCKAGIRFDKGSPHYEDKLFEFIFKKMREQLMR